MDGSVISANPKPTDARQRPPESIRTLYKTYQRASPATLDYDPGILDINRGIGPEQELRLHLVDHVRHDNVRTACTTFGGHGSGRLNMLSLDVPVYESTDVPGLILIPSLLPHQTQRDLSSRLLHTALANSRHKTNIHVHYDIPYRAIKSDNVLKSNNGEASFFNLSPNSTEEFRPLNPEIRNPITVSQFLRKKLRWITLGGQYDWNEKVYHTEDPPPFPPDIADLMRSFFTSTKPEVAIVNIYSPGDTLSIHRDVSEESTKGLISISLGCDCIFVVGLGATDGKPQRNLAIRLRSGDALYMSGQSRFAWHGVPQVIQGTCPPWLSDWPAQTATMTADGGVPADKYESWRDWMSNKRINFNVRQLNQDGV